MSEKELTYGLSLGLQAEARQRKNCVAWFKREFPELTNIVLYWFKKKFEGEPKRYRKELEKFREMFKNE